MQVYLVGGAVRDEMLGRPVKERDYVVVGATEKDMEAKGFTRVGSDFPVFLHPKTKEEYALARTERKNGKGYTGFECYAAPDVTLEQDLLRRDLTVNAMAKDSQDNIYDPFNGKSDLENKILRHISPAFTEDPLRVFRVARFAARYAYLGFTVHPDTITLMQHIADTHELEHLTAERVWQETRRSLMDGAPDVFFSVLADSHAMSYWFAELPVPPSPHFNALAAAVRANLPIEARMAALLALLPEKDAHSLCQRLKTPNAVTDLVKLSSAHHARLLDEALSADMLLALFDQTDAWRKPERFALLTETVKCVSTTDISKRLDTILKALEAARNVDAGAIARQGLKGPEIKQAVRAARSVAIAGQIS